MSTQDDSARPVPGAEQMPSSDNEAVERQVAPYQSEFLGGRVITYYINLAKKLAALIDELEARPSEEQPYVTLKRLRDLLAEIQGNIKSMEKDLD